MNADEIWQELDPSLRDRFEAGLLARVDGEEWNDPGVTYLQDRLEKELTRRYPEVTYEISTSELDDETWDDDNDLLYDFELPADYRCDASLVLSISSNTRWRDSPIRLAVL